MSAAPGRPQGAHGVDRKAEHYDAFAYRCNAKGVPLEVFYPDKGKAPKRAKAYCIPCPVRQQCLEYALKYSENYGVWGGFSETERRVIRRQQKVLAAQQEANA